MVLRDGRTKQEARDWALQSQTASWKETGKRSEQPKVLAAATQEPGLSHVSHCFPGAATLF